MASAQETIEKQLRQLKEFTAIGDEIVGETDLSHVLKRVAEAIREHSDYRRVVVSRFLDNEREREIACAGVSDEETNVIKALKWSDQMRKELFHDRFRIGHSYYIPHDLKEALPLSGVQSRIPRVEMKDWHPNDFLFIPLYGRGRKQIGMISVDDPRDGRAPTAEALRPLELFAEQAARAIEEAELKRELVETKDNLQRLIDSTPDAIIATDSHGVVTFYSDGAQRMFGYLPDEIVGKHLAQFYSDDPEVGKERARKIMDELLSSETETITGRTLEFPAKEGGWLPVVISAGILRNEEGAVLGTIGVARDISEDVRLRQQIMEKNRKLEAKNSELEEFVYVASHDLQAPLVSIQGFAAKLTREYEELLGQSGLHSLARLNANVSRISLLLRSLLDLSRASTKTIDKIPTLLSDLLKDTLEDFDEMIKEKNATVKVLHELPVVHCDGIQVAQVFSNLLGNALKYCSPHRPPVIEVGAEDRDTCHAIFIRDNGVGIQEAESESVFRPFKRLRVKSVDGMGIGLSIAQRIIERHEGRIYIERNETYGCTFWFDLPKRKQAVKR